MRKVFVVGAIALVASGIGCGGGTGSSAPPPPAVLDPLVSAKTVAPASVTAGESIDVSCLVVDQQGVVQQAPTDVTPTIVFAPEDSVEADTATGKTIAVRAGTVDVHCSFPTLSLVDDTGATVNIFPGPVSSVDTSVHPSSIVAGGTVTATCIAYDAYGNLVPGATPTLNTTPTDGGNTITGTSGTFTHAGLYDLSCEVPGAKSRPAQLEVTPSLPATIALTPSPTKSVYPVGSVVTLDTAVADQYGNPIVDAPTTYASSPLATDSFGESRFRYLTPGFYTVKASVPPPTQTGNTLVATATIEVGGVGPTITCDSPADGSMTNAAPGSIVSFGGTVDSPNGVVSVTVNGADASLAGGKFTSPLTTRFGINFVDVVATDKNGAQNSQTCSFLAANQWATESTLYADTVSLKLTQGAIDDGNRSGPIGSFDDMLYDVVNSAGLRTQLDTSLKAANPIKPLACDNQTCTFLGCICWDSSGVEYLGQNLAGPNTTDLQLVNGGLAAHALLTNVNIQLRVHGDIGPIPYDTSGWVTFSSIDVRLTLDTALSGGRPHVSVRPGSVSTNVGSISTNFGGVDGWIINNILVPLAQGLLRDKVSSLLSGYVTNNFDSLIDGVVSGLDVSTLGSTFNVPRLDGSGTIPLSFGVGFSTLNTTTSRLLAGISTKFSAPPGQARTSLGIAIPTGTVLDDPSVNAPNTTAAAIHVGLFNQVLYSLWRAGMFDATLTGAQLGGGMPAGASVQILSPLPPVAAMSGSSVELSLGAMQLAVTYPGLFGGTDPSGNPIPPLLVELGARGTSAPTLVGNDLKFGAVTITELHFSTANATVTSAARDKLQALLETVIQHLVDTSLNSSLPSLPIPAFQLPASVATYGLPTGKLGLLNPSLALEVRDFVLRGALGVQ